MLLVFCVRFVVCILVELVLLELLLDTEVDVDVVKSLVARIDEITET